MRSLFQMARLGNILIAEITLAAGIFLSQGIFTLRGIAANAIAFAFAIAFGNILNDIFDLEIDKINRPSRPLPAGKISVRSAKIFADICAAITLAAGFISPSPTTHLLFFFALLILLFFYDKNIKRIPLIKNVCVAILCTTPLMRSLFLPQANFYPIYTAIGFAFLFTFAREIFKDLEDTQGDLNAGIITFPLVVGENKASLFASLLLLFSLLSIPIPVAIGWMPRSFLWTLIPLIPLVFFTCRFSQKKQYRTAQKLTKSSMVVGLFFLIFSHFI